MVAAELFSEPVGVGPVSHRMSWIQVLGSFAMAGLALFFF
jgi:hypothetical protein